MINCIKSFNNPERGLPAGGDEEGVLRRGFNEWKKWLKQEEKIHRVKVGGYDAVMDIRGEAMDKFGDFRYGDDVKIPDQSPFPGEDWEGTVVGVHGGRLWWERKKGGGCWYVDNPGEVKKIRVVRRGGVGYVSKIVPKTPVREEEEEEEGGDEEGGEEEGKGEVEVFDMESLPAHMQQAIRMLQDVFPHYPAEYLRLLLFFFYWFFYFCYFFLINLFFLGILWKLVAVTPKLG